MVNNRNKIKHCCKILYKYMTLEKPKNLNMDVFTSVFNHVYPSL